MAFALGRQAHGFVDQQLGNGEAVVYLGEAQVSQGHIRPAERCMDRALRPFKGQDVALGDGQGVVDLSHRADLHLATKRPRTFGRGEDDRSGAVADQRAIGQAQGVGHERVALGHVVAVLEIHLPMHLRQRVGHGVGVVFGGDGRHRAQRAVVTLGVLAGGAAEQLRETQAGFGRIVLVTGPGQGLGDCGGAGVGHLLGAHYQYQLGAAGENRIDPRLDRCRAGRTGVFTASSRFEAQPGVGLQ